MADIDFCRDTGLTRPYAPVGLASLNLSASLCMYRGLEASNASKSRCVGLRTCLCKIDVTRWAVIRGVIHLRSPCIFYSLRQNSL